MGSNIWIESPLLRPVRNDFRRGDRKTINALDNILREWSLEQCNKGIEKKVGEWDAEDGPLGQELPSWKFKNRQFGESRQGSEFFCVLIECGKLFVD